MVSGVCFTASAQKIYLQGGLNLANITTNNSGHTESNKMLPTFNAGLMARLKLPGIVGIETGLLLTGRGSKTESSFPLTNPDAVTHVTSKFNPLYLEVPLNLILKFPLGLGTGLYFNAGPYIAMGVGGKSKVETSGGIAGSTKSEEKIEFTNSDPFTSQQNDAAYNRLKRYDYGVNIGGGFNFKKLILKANYGIGFTKINSTSSDNSSNNKNKYRTLSFSVGIPLGLGLL